MPEAGAYTTGNIIQYVGPDVLNTHDLTQQEADDGFDIFTLPKKVYFNSVPTIDDYIRFTNDNIYLEIEIFDESDRAGVDIRIDDYSTGVSFSVAYSEDENDPTHLTYFRTDENSDDLTVVLTESASLDGA